MLQRVEADLKEVVQGPVDVTGRRRWKARRRRACGSRGGVDGGSFWWWPLGGELSSCLGGRLVVVVVVVVGLATRSDRQTQRQRQRQRQPARFPSRSPNPNRVCEGSEGQNGSPHPPLSAAHTPLSSVPHLTSHLSGNGGQSAGISLGRHSASQA